ncbi:hypothetical protein HYS94_02280 [Candidatus Daviesbacteria bacterium]|nr:hypothetical protein [Candidatus Daviesbacteria bacterium]
MLREEIRERSIGEYSHSFTEVRTERDDFDIYRETSVALWHKRIPRPRIESAPWTTRQFGERTVRVDSAGRPVGRLENVFLLQNGEFPEFHTILTETLAFKRDLEINFPDYFSEDGKPNPEMYSTILRALYMVVRLVTRNLSPKV